jgi:hypothetical protein
LGLLARSREAWLFEYLALDPGKYQSILYAQLAEHVAVSPQDRLVSSVVSREHEINGGTGLAHRR